MNFMLFGSHIVCHDMQMAYYLALTTHIQFKYILHDMMLIGSETRKVGHDLDLKNLF